MGTKVAVKIPTVGESITEGNLSKWLKASGEYVEQGEILLQLETDKASVEVIAEVSGVLHISVTEGTVKIGQVVGEIEATSERPAGSSEDKPSAAQGVSTPTSGIATTSSQTQSGGPVEKRNDFLSPAVRRVVTERGLDPSEISATGPKGNITKADALNAVSSAPVTPPGMRRVPMTMIRKRIAERLVDAQNTAAILTTFNEIDMTAVQSFRSKHKEAFKAQHGFNLGFMGIFTKAVVEALKVFPEVNASIDGTDILYKDFFNVGIAVGTEKGLMVPVVKGADKMSLTEIELKIREYAGKARDGKITIDDLSGGTFTISNGGVYGSLMSTPILNPPQSGILGLHKIQDRPVVVEGQIVIRPMMYVALSYDHRMIDGGQSVTFLIKVKEGVENPTALPLGM